MRVYGRKWWFQNPRPARSRVHWPRLPIEVGETGRVYFLPRTLVVVVPCAWCGTWTLVSPLCRDCAARIKAEHPVYDRKEEV